MTGKEREKRRVARVKNFGYALSGFMSRELSILLNPDNPDGLASKHNPK